MREKLLGWKAFLFLVLLMGFLAGLPSQPAGAEPLASPPPLQAGLGASPWSLVFFAGALSENKAGEDILPPQKFDNDFMVGAGVNYRFWKWRDMLSAEAEGVLAQHFGNQEFGELGAVVMLRWLLFPWNDCLRTSFALGEGVSYAFEIPDIERRDPGHGPNNNLLNLMIFELSAAPASAEHLALVARLHHRSPAFSLFGENRESNFFTLGLRYNF